MKQAYDVLSDPQKREVYDQYVANIFSLLPFHHVANYFMRVSNHIFTSLTLP